MNHDTHQAWLIDLDGTLYRATPLRLLMAAELALCGWPAVRILRRFRAEHERLRHAADSAATTPYDLQIERTADALGLSTGQVRGVVHHWMHERPQKWLPRCTRQQLVRDIKAFRESGGRIAVVSDYPACAKLAALGLTPLVDAVISSGETADLKRLKPAPDGYLLAAQTLDVPASRCLVIGDRDDTDGLAANQAGMEFLHVRRIGELRPVPAYPTSEKAGRELALGNIDSGRVV